MVTIGGQDQVNRNIRRVADDMLKRIINHVGATGEKVATHAKSDHTRGFAHAVERYENQTTNLTNSIMAQMTQADANRVESIIFAAREYAPLVELGGNGRSAYPFMWPALVSEQQNFIDGFKKIGFRE